MPLGEPDISRRQFSISVPGATIREGATFFLSGDAKRAMICIVLPSPISLGVSLRAVPPYVCQPLPSSRLVRIQPACEHRKSVGREGGIDSWVTDWPAAPSLSQRSRSGFLSKGERLTQCQRPGVSHPGPLENSENFFAPPVRTEASDHRSQYGQTSDCAGHEAVLIYPLPIPD